MSVVMNEEGLRHLLYDPVGPLGAYIDLKAREVDVLAHNNVRGRPGPKIRTGTLYLSIRYGGPPIQTADGPLAVIGTDARPSHQGRVGPHANFNYPLALELGMPGRAGELPTRQGPWGTRVETQGSYRYPFLEPALKSAFGKA